MVLTALDSDVIKTYVELGMGVGIVAQMAYDADRDTAFEKVDAGHLFRRRPPDLPCAAERSCAATSTSSFVSSHRRSIARRSTRPSGAEGRDR